MSFLTTNLGQFAYFDLQLSHPPWRGRRILDFGGNTGNILKDPNSTIELGHRVITAAHLANMAYRSGKKIVWDAEKEEVVKG